MQPLRTVVATATAATQTQDPAHARRSAAAPPAALLPAVAFGGGREMLPGDDGLPAQIRVNGAPLLAAPMAVGLKVSIAAAPTPLTFSPHVHTSRPHLTSSARHLSSAPRPPSPPPHRASTPPLLRTPRHLSSAATPPLLRTSPHQIGGRAVAWRAASRVAPVVALRDEGHASWRAEATSGRTVRGAALVVSGPQRATTTATRVWMHRKAGGRRPS